MRVHLVALGTYGDVLPLIAIGVELKRRGHDVGLAASTPFGPFAIRAGLDFHALGTPADYEGFVAEPDLWHPMRGITAVFRFASAMIEPTYDWLASVARPGESIVVGSTISLGTRLAQDKLGLPLVTVHVMPFVMESRVAPPRLPGLPLPSFFTPRLKAWFGRGADMVVIGPTTLPTLHAVQAKLGLKPTRRVRWWWNLATKVVVMFPDWYAPAQPDWPLNAVQVGFPIADRLGDAQELPPDLAAFLDEGEPPLVFSYGSGMRKSRAFFETAVQLCARMKRRGVLLAPEQGQVPDTLPPGIIHARYAPLSRLLPRAAALVHHGGIGTVAQALKAGVPQLVVPVAFNHFDEVIRLERLGLGVALSRRRFTPGRAARALDALLADPKVAAACRAAKDRMDAEDGVADACDAIERTFAETVPAPAQ